MRPISFQRRSDILSAANQGLSLRAVARRLSVGYGTVHRVIHKAGVNVIRRKTGRPRKITQAVQRIAVRAVTAGKVDTAVDVQRLLAVDYSVNVTPQTVRNMLTESGLKAAPKVKKPLLTKRHRRLRLKFAKKYQYCGP
jgi:transposase